MTLTRAVRRLICRGLIGLLLFTQLAVASYACPALAPTGVPAQADVQADGAISNDPGAQRRGMASMSADASAAHMITCDQMGSPSDQASPNLCAEHCHAGQQSAQVHVPATPAVALVSLYIVAPTVTEALRPMSATAASVDAVAMAPPPPHAILHCCIRD
jgi:hypothetical protein